MTKTTGIVRDDRFLAHHMGPEHPESPGRLKAIHARLDAEPGLPLLPIEPRPATEDELELVHAPEYIGFLSGTAGRDFVPLDSDTAATALTYETARLAAGGTIEAADAVLRGNVENALALVRPPGHHAESNRAMGFCFFNNAALAAEYLVRRRGLRRVLIVDWDLHHGNGTQHTFDGRSDVLYFSTHQSPLFPGTGSVAEKGHGPGEGFTVNVPLRPGKTDGDYLHIHRHILGPIAAEFEPEFIIVSAGFDICAGDPLGGMLVSRDGFGALAAESKRQAAALCGGRLLLVLEGGYRLEALAEGVRAVIGQMAGIDPLPQIEPVLSPGAGEEIARTLPVAKRYWKSL
ncbi:MAG: histone deacetylase [Acidobacteriota bacterium]|nr:histone deacetylase [Acidobacteriota bacterium]